MSGTCHCGFDLPNGHTLCPNCVNHELLERISRLPTSLDLFAAAALPLMHGASPEVKAMKAFEMAQAMMAARVVALREWYRDA